MLPAPVFELAEPEAGGEAGIALTSLARRLQSLMPGWERTECEETADSPWAALRPAFKLAVHGEPGSVTPSSSCAGKLKGRVWLC